MSKWHKDKWKSKAEAVKGETGQALLTLFQALNQGQQNKLLKNEAVKTLLERYGVI